MNTHKTLKHLLIPLVSLLCITPSHAQDVAEAKGELLKKGNTWKYDVTLTIPAGLEFTSEYDTEATVTDKGKVYKFKEIQQSLGKSKIDDLDSEAYRVNIFIDDEHKKQQILNVVDGALAYYGTYIIDLKNPGKKQGYLTKAPIILYSNKAKVAEKWEWKHTKIPAFQFRVISKDRDVTVKAGTFKADKIRMEQIDNKTKNVLISKEIWYVQDIGIVKETEKQYIKEGKAVVKTLDLTSFSNAPIKQ